MFISFKDWQNLDIFDPRDTYQDWKSKEWYDYYKAKFIYAEMSKANHVLEIGVRLGYSAYAFMFGSCVETYAGWDIQQPLDGGMPYPTFDWVEEKIFPKHKMIHTSLLKIDTQHDLWPNCVMYDFIHIDGDHSYQGALKDCRNAYSVLTEGGVMVVDDYFFIPEVKKAVDEFLSELDMPKIEGHSKRGDVLICKV